jgi:hypothetical protein
MYGNNVRYYCRLCEQSTGERRKNIRINIDTSLIEILKMKKKTEKLAECKLLL